MRSTVAKACWYSFGLLTIVFSIGRHLAATITPVPEIDGSSLSAGLALLAGGILILRSRLRK